MGILGWFDDVEATLSRIDRSTKRIEDKVDMLTGSMLTLHRKIGMIMALVQVEQGDLDALDASRDQVAASRAQKIQDLMDAVTEPLPPAQMDALNADVEALRALAAPTPAEPPV